ncbi:hypothetical protein EST38_g3330 [Candolleomyces aberdarensis]|uniref:Fe2OG dioxygenase domain-containing protein n=1 Tax=Candolleomyces aberdarensis TaxID=2316362 RepID=A0A4Q2DQN7_9AGAR|nr:hypothetical protein EST38_g3330 [Candolleomyces aberdarensis]
MVTNVLQSAAHLKAEDNFKKVYEPLNPLSETLSAHMGIKNRKIWFIVCDVDAGIESEPQTLPDNLVDAFEQALLKKPDLDKNFYCNFTAAGAPNPGLSIEGIGPIGLPLTDRDANLIISVASQAPFGKGEQTLIQRSVRDTWEIDPTKLTFRNPEWMPYVDKLASTTIWKGLDVAPYTSRPRCEFYKLLLYQTGFHFLPHQDTSKSDGMFATVIIVLPSSFEGGEVHLSHAGKNAVIDLSQVSEFKSSVLAWYTDVIHEVKPVKSGYRLALSYNLIQTSPNAPIPFLPDMQGMIQDVRRVLRKWKDGKFEPINFENSSFETRRKWAPVIAYILSHKYSERDLKSGAPSLKGSDAQLVGQLLPIAKDMGFTVCVGKLTYTRQGRWMFDADESVPEYDEEDGPDIVRYDMESYEITHLKCLSHDVELDFTELEITEDVLVPKEPFINRRPNEVEWDIFTGNEGGDVQHSIAKTASPFNFFLYLARDLRRLQENQNRPPSSVIAESSSRSSADHKFEELVHSCVMTALQCCEESGSRSDACQFVELCIAWNARDLCRYGLAAFARMEDPARMPRRLRNFYTGFVPALKEKIFRQGLRWTSELFGSFFRTLISAYLVQVLGSKESPPKLPPMPPIGCGCEDCNNLDAFMNDNRPTYHYRHYDKWKKHLKKRITSDRDICLDFSTLSEKGALQIRLTKYSQLLDETNTWDERQAVTKEVLEGFGDTGEVAEIMGDRYDDVLRAVEGQQPFVGLDDEGLGGIFSVDAIQADMQVDETQQPVYQTAVGSTQDLPMLAGVKRKELHSE